MNQIISTETRILSNSIFSLELQYNSFDNVVQFIEITHGALTLLDACWIALFEITMFCEIVKFNTFFSFRLGLLIVLMYVFVYSWYTYSVYWSLIEIFGYKYNLERSIKRGCKCTRDKVKIKLLNHKPLHQTVVRTMISVQKMSKSFFRETLRSLKRKANGRVTYIIPVCFPFFTITVLMFTLGNITTFPLELIHYVGSRGMSITWCLSSNPTKR